MIEVILDTETTGLSADKDRIVEIACVELNNHIPTKKVFHTFLNPEIKVSADRKSTRLNSSHSQQSRMPSSA